MPLCWCSAKEPPEQEEPVLFSLKSASQMLQYEMATGSWEDLSMSVNRGVGREVVNLQCTKPLRVQSQLPQHHLQLQVLLPVTLGMGEVL